MFRLFKRRTKTGGAKTSGRSTKSSATRTSHPRIKRVGVTFVSLDEPVRYDRRPYVYKWNLPTPPREGLRVLLPANYSSETPQWGAVIQLDAPVPPGYTESELSFVSRIATGAELDRAAQRESRKADAAAADEVAWLRMGLKVLGLPTGGRTRAKPPEGYYELKAPTGSAGKVQANAYGSSWWKAMKRAESLGWNEEQVQAFREAGRYWFKVRDSHN